VLVELAGKPVPSNAAEFNRCLAGLRPGTSVPAVVLRAGKKQPIKALTVPSSKATQPKP
jgi:hypothetical protein